MKHLCDTFTIHKTLIVLLILFLAGNVSYSQGSCASPDGPFIGFDGSSPNYATANANGWCYNNLTAGQTYCWTYNYPATGLFKVMVIINSSCGNCDGSFSLTMPSGCSGGCSSVGVIGCGQVQYNTSCAIQQSGGMEHGGAGSCTPAQVCNSNFTMCITIPGGCATMDVCPMVHCANGVGNCAGLMPIELLSFTGKNDCEKNIISWTSTTETNNDFYTVEKSIDGKNFSVISTVDGTGTSSTSVNYEFIDSSLPNGEGWGGALYYRLKQTDFDGKSETFNPIAVKKDCGNIISISPSLTKDVVFIHSDGNSLESISVFDMFGRKIIYSFIPKGIMASEINLAGFPKGIYTITVASEKEMTTKKIIHQ